MRRVVDGLCYIVATCGARLSSAGIVGILKKLGRDTIRDGEKHKSVIALDGGLYEHYKEFSSCMGSTLRELVGEEVSENIVIEHSMFRHWSVYPGSLSFPIPGSQGILNMYVC